jgi:hypothetical protein
LLSVHIFLDDNHFCLLNAGAIPEVIVDVVLSDDDDDTESGYLPGQTISTDHVEPSLGSIPAVDDTGDAGKRGLPGRRPNRSFRWHKNAMLL